MHYRRAVAHLLCDPSLPDRLPAPIAWRVADLIDGSHPGPPWVEGLYVAESVFRFVALLIKAAYLEQARPDPVINQLIRLHLTWPSMGAWRQFVERVHRRSRAGGWTPDLPGFAPLLDAIADASGLVTVRNSSLGHPGGRLDDEAAALTWAAVEGPLLRLLEVADAVLSPCRLLVQDAAGERWLQWTGAVDEGRPAHAVEEAEMAPALLELPGRAPVPLFPLVLRTSSELVEKTAGAIRNRLVLFDGADHGRKHLILVGRRGQARTKAWFQQWQSRMHALRVPTVPLGDETLTPDVVLGRLRDALEVALDEVDGGFEAVALDVRATGSLDVALASECRFAFLGGAAGAGKSTLLAQAARRWAIAGVPVLFLQARDLASDRFSDRFRGLVEGATGIPARPEALLAHLAAATATRPAVLVDGLDEIGSPGATLRFLGDLRRWAAKVSALVVVTCRSDVWRDLQRVDRERRGRVFDLLAPRSFRMSGKGRSGADEDMDLIPLPPLDDARARACWETYRTRGSGHQTATTWAELPNWARAWCRNPRRMMRLLGHLQGGAPAGDDRWSVWRAWVDREAASGVARAAMRRLVAVQQELGAAEVPLASLFPGPWGSVPSEEYTAAQRLVSSGIWRLRVSPAAPERSLLVSFASPELAVVVWCAGEPFFGNDGSAARELVTRLAEGSAAPLLRDACARHVAVVDGDLSCWAWLDDSVLGAAWLGAERHGRILELRIPAGRSAVVVAACRQAFDEGRVHELVDRADDLLAAEPEWLDGPAIEWLARVLRHGDRPSLDTRLSVYVQHGGLVGASARLALAELRRESGRWRPALDAYDAALVHPCLSDEQHVLALAAAGECHIWLLEDDAAMALFERAFSLLPTDASPFVRCNLHIKRSIVWRRKHRPVLAARDLEEAAAIADHHHLRVERAKIDLEKGLTLFLFGYSDPALRLMDAALAAHRQLHFIKGIKKALYCRGLLLRSAGRLDEARVSLEESRELNKRHFDLLGLALVHQALAEVEPDRAAHHQACFEKYANKLGGLPHADQL